MAATILYDEPITNLLAVDSANATKLPVESRNFSRINNNFATVTGTVQFDASYPTGGYPVSTSTNGAAKFGLKVCQMVAFSHQGGYLVSYNQSTDKIQVYQQGVSAGPLAEVANAVNLSAVPAVAFMAHGRQY